MTILKVISGGQTGVDRAGLDVAMHLGIACGGWCPCGRRAEDGIIDDRYPLTETPSKHYAQRTEWNVRDGDGTLILYRPPLSGGTLFTKTVAAKLRKPCLLMEMTEVDTKRIRQWLERQAIGVLNIAGPRESQRPGIYDQAYAALTEALNVKAEQDRTGRTPDCPAGSC